jgi:hypothetical protein|tara:strand:+ start:407 stop:628 length:222 start_codon:yes stop_codon:yes gene_type:complete
MNFNVRIDGSKLIIFNVVNGAIHKVISLPTGATYSGPIVSGDVATVSIHYKNGTNRSRTYNLKTGSLKSDIGM